MSPPRAEADFDTTWATCCRPTTTRWATARPGVKPSCPEAAGQTATSATAPRGSHARAVAGAPRAPGGGTGWSGRPSGLRKGVMRQATTLRIVERATGLVRPDVERATGLVRPDVEAALRTLAERITRGEAEDVVAFLPPEVRAWLTSAPEPAEGFDRWESIRRVAEREGVDPATAEEHVRGIFEVLGFAACARGLPGPARGAQPRGVLRHDGAAVPGLRAAAGLAPPRRGGPPR
jgi:uncharacterized protein (DUF2267 family)